MISPKEYQNRVLGSLRDFLHACGNGESPAQAFHAVVASNGGPYFEYQPVHAASPSPEMPYVCLRVPTDGDFGVIGKTCLSGMRE